MSSSLNEIDPFLHLSHNLTNMPSSLRIVELHLHDHPFHLSAIAAKKHRQWATAEIDRLPLDNQAWSSIPNEKQTDSHKFDHPTGVDLYRKISSTRHLHKKTIAMPNGIFAWPFETSAFSLTSWNGSKSNAYQWLWQCCSNFIQHHCYDSMTSCFVVVSYLCQLGAHQGYTSILAGTNQY